MTLSFDRARKQEALAALLMILSLAVIVFFCLFKVFDLIQISWFWSLAPLATLLIAALWEGAALRRMRKEVMGD